MAKKATKRRRNKAGKGSQWEREICTTLSLWWTDGEHDDRFWRSSQSGGRATQRYKKHKSTHGQYGDITSTHPTSAPLTDLLSIELKRGYNKFTFHDVIDRSESGAQQMYEDFIRQAYTSSLAGGTPGWMLLTKRDRRESMCFLERTMFESLKEHGAFLVPPLVQVTLLFPLLVPDNKGKSRLRRFDIVGILFDEWIELVPPSAIKNTLREYNERTG